jgi:hypothetical protein
LEKGFLKKELKPGANWRVIGSNLLVLVQVAWNRTRTLLKTGTTTKLDQNKYFLKNQTWNWVPNSICVWHRVCF